MERTAIKRNLTIENETPKKNHIHTAWSGFHSRTNNRRDTPADKSQLQSQ